MRKIRVATSWLLLLGLAAAATAGVVFQARAQPDSNDFVSIDCGLPGTANSEDDTTKLSYAPDAAFTDAGSNHNISAKYISSTLPKRYLNVRSFPDDGVRNCYTLRSLEAGLKYLLRAEFMYGNYDGLNQPPVFDLYAGVNFWSRVNVSSSDDVERLEAIVVVPHDTFQVCLVNTGSGTPFISALELRPLKNSLYTQANATQGLVLLIRRNFGTTDATDVVRNISFSGLGGDISSSFANLNAVQYLDLSHNNFTGSIPDVLSQLPSLRVLDLTSNQLNGSIPSGLLKRVQDGSLDLRYGNNPNICTNADSCKPTTKRKSKLDIYIAVLVVLVVVIVSMVALIFLILIRKRQGSTSTTNTMNPQNETPMSYAAEPLPPGDAWQSSLHLENRRFTYKELEMITNNFQCVLGRGGFGKVYDGFLEDGTQVAVKLRSQSSNQGVKEFLSEVQILTRIHHKNLVSMIGYCMDVQYMALVYEYMSEGTLQEQIAGNGRNGKHITWRQRLRIALDSAHGLEYLHKGCNPPLIHRDVKATNILLNSKLEAKIADFGLSKAFNHDNETHVSTNTLIGTPGYVDPDFGVVMLELVTGRQAILSDPEPTSIIQWVRRRLSRGQIEDVVDIQMRGEYDVNIVWKVVDIALECTMQAAMQRPTMTDVVAQLQECFELEDDHRTRDGTRGSFYTSNNIELDLGYNTYAVDSKSSEVSQDSSAFEMDRNVGKVPRMGRGPSWIFNDVISPN